MRQVVNRARDIEHLRQSRYESASSDRLNRAASLLEDKRSHERQQLEAASQNLVKKCADVKDRREQLQTQRTNDLVRRMEERTDSHKQIAATKRRKEQVKQLQLRLAEEKRKAMVQRQMQEHEQASEDRKQQMEERHRRAQMAIEDRSRHQAAARSRTLYTSELIRRHRHPDEAGDILPPHAVPHPPSKPRPPRPKQPLVVEAGETTAGGSPSTEPNTAAPDSGS